jgi:hypothetical protein
MTHVPTLKKTDKNKGNKKTKHLEENYIIKQRLTLYWDTNNPPFLTQLQTCRRPTQIGSDLYIGEEHQIGAGRPQDRSTVHSTSSLRKQPSAGQRRNPVKTKD